MSVGPFLGDTSVGGLLNCLRAAGWVVAVHNDYRMDGKSMTFWLFTKTKEVPCEFADGLFLKGEGETDFLALMECIRKTKVFG